jgi:hypothetical protein
MNPYLKVFKKGTSVVDKIEALIVSALRKRIYHDIHWLEIRIQFITEAGKSLEIKDVFTEDAKDQKRLKGLCRVLGIKFTGLSPDDLVARRVVVCRLSQIFGDGNFKIVRYVSPYKRTLRASLRNKGKEY